MPRFPAALLAALLAGLASCGGSARPGAGPGSIPRKPTPAPVPGALAGTWVWQTAGASASGDHEEARERWTLSHTGALVSGHYDREVTRRSGDGRVFACNRGETQTRRARVWVEGQLSATGALSLRETRHQTARSLCDDGERPHASYRGRLTDAGLELDREGAHQLLRKASGAPPPELDWNALLRAPTVGDLAGIWRSVSTTRDENGRVRSEYEVWHLEAKGDDLTGYYDHVVTVTAREGHRFACANGPEYTLRTRYRVAGTVSDTGQVFLNETTYETVPNPCENNQRRLEQYEGRSAGGELLLGWGGGAQLLTRVDPA